MKTYTIPQLIDHPSKPAAWRVIQSVDKGYNLQCSFNPGSFEYITTRKGNVKYYGTLDAVFNDISRVSQNSTVHYQAKELKKAFKR